MPENAQRLAMTPEEIRTSYHQAADPRKQIRVLAELNACSQAVIREILTAAGEELQAGRTVRRWSREEDERLKELSRYMTSAGIAAELGRTEKSVNARFRILHEAEVSNRETEDEDTRRAPDIDVCEETAADESADSEPAADEPVEKKPVGWTKEEEELLIKLVEEGYKRREISGALGRSINSVKHKTMELKKRGRLGNDETELSREEVLELLYYAIGEELSAGREALLVDVLSALGYAVLRYFITEGNRRGRVHD